MNRNQKILLAIALLVGLGAVLYFTVFKDSSDNSDGDNQQEIVNTEESTNQIDSEQNDIDSENSEPQESAPKESVSSSEQVDEKPVVGTGYGLNPSSPLPRGQLTSSTCTTDAKVKCSISFTNQSTNEVVKFEEKETDSQGVAIWYWTGGEEVDSGTWNLVAYAGDKISDTEVIYVE
jgi:hypothetical protein